MPSKVLKAYKYRIYPDQEQQAALSIQFGHARFVYNWALAFRKSHYAEHGKGLTYYDTNWALTKLKKVVPWLKEADSQVLQEKLRDLDRSYKNFFDGRAEYPKLKSKHHQQSIRYPQRFKLEGSRTYLPKVGWVRTIFHRPLEGKMKNLTVTKTKSGKYFISIQVEVEKPEPDPVSGTVGIDLGLKHFAILSRPILWEGEWRTEIPHPQHFRQSERKLAALQRKHSRSKKGSAGREKIRLRISRLHERIANQRADFLHKLSCAIADQYGHIKIENLNVAGMFKNHNLAKSISDSGWGEFARQLGYKSEWLGGITERIDRFYPSSKTCSVCGLVNQDLQLHHRFWNCDDCGTEHDRDQNAAVNIEQFYAGGSRRRNAGGVDVIPVSELVRGGSWTAKPEAQRL